MSTKKQEEVTLPVFLVLFDFSISEDNHKIQICLLFRPAEVQ